MHNHSFFPPEHCMKLYPQITKIFLALLTVAWTALPAPAAEGVQQSSAPINIEADRMVSREQDNSVVFTGNVDARQGEVVIRTDEMTVYYHQDNDKGVQEGSSRVKKLICIGNVQISQDDWLGTGKRMDYFAEDRKVILSGDAKAWQGQNMVAGKTITYYLDEGRSIVEGPAAADSADKSPAGGKTGRVKAVIQSDKPAQ
jgi:lipopolysaccharide export system protein LptA